MISDTTVNLAISLDHFGFVNVHKRLLKSSTGSFYNLLVTICNPQNLQSLNLYSFDTLNDAILFYIGSDSVNVEWQHCDFSIVSLLGHC